MFWNFVSLLESSILHMCVFLKQLHPIVNYRYLEGSRFGILKTIEYAHHRLNNCSYRTFCLCIIIDSRILRSPLDTSQIFNFSRKKDPPTVSTGVVQQLKIVGFPTKCKKKILPTKNAKIPYFEVLVNFACRKNYCHMSYHIVS